MSSFQSASGCSCEESKTVGARESGGQHGQSWQTFLWVTAGLWFMLLFCSFVAGVVAETV